MTAALADVLTGHVASVLRLEFGVRAVLADRLRTHDAPPVGELVPAGSLTGVHAAVQAQGDDGIAAPHWLHTRGAVATGSADPPLDPHRAQ
ncbi:hypothetical protein, partial [Streptomyces sp. BE303]|uniref:hypothetical protein n=1 Tax=Streptomyces sp. BE303 TaxID=3002528 RepID=UPI002E75AD53